MIPTEIIDSLLSNMISKEMIGFQENKIVTYNIEYAQDRVHAPFIGLGNHDTIIQALKYLKESDEPITMGHIEWIKRLRI